MMMPVVDTSGIIVEWTESPVVSPRDANHDVLNARIEQALDANRTYLARSAPTAAQTTAQVQTLTRECSALIRLLLGALDATD